MNEPIYDDTITILRPVFFYPGGIKPSANLVNDPRMLATSRHIKIGLFSSEIATAKRVLITSRLNPLRLNII